MIRSVERVLHLSQLSALEVVEAKKLPDLASMVRDLGIPDFYYLAIQRMGSHAVHGTWTDLLSCYLTDENGQLRPRDHDVDTEDVQFLALARFVLLAMISFLLYITQDKWDIEPLMRHLAIVDQNLESLQAEAWSEDYVILESPNG